MSGSGVSREAPARRDGRAVLAVDGPQASLDRAAGTNQEIERGNRRTEARRLSPAWRTDPLTEAIALPAAVGAEQCCSGASVVDA